MASPAAKKAAILVGALPHLPVHGFTLRSIQAGFISSSLSSPSPPWPTQAPPTTGQEKTVESHRPSSFSSASATYDERTLRALFPGSPSARSSLEQALLSTWEEAGRRAMWGHATTSLLDSDSDVTLKKELEEKEKGLSMDVRLRQALRRRLAWSEALGKDALVEALALRSILTDSALPIAMPSIPLSLLRVPPLPPQATLSALISASPLPLPPHYKLLLASVVPGLLERARETLETERRKGSDTIALPVLSPFGLLERAASVADEACAVVGDGRQGIDWYATRARLGIAYLCAELHLLSQPAFASQSRPTSSSFPSTASTHPSNHATYRLLDRLLLLGLRFDSGTDELDTPPEALERKESLLEESSRAGEEAMRWMGWVGRSWTGILRSLGA